MYLPDQVREALWRRTLVAIRRAAKQRGWTRVEDTLDKWALDPQLQDSFFLAVHRSKDRVIAQCTELPQTLETSIGSEEGVLEDEDVLAALWVLVTQPGTHDPAARALLLNGLARAFDGDAAEGILETLLPCLLESVVNELLPLPGTESLRQLYALRFQQVSVAHLRELTTVVRSQGRAVARLPDQSPGGPLPLPGLLPPPTPIRPRPYHNVPRPDFARLVGRDKELARLRVLLNARDRVFQVALVGIGGVGKSALAQAMADELIARYDSLDPDDRFDAIVWASAKEEVLTAFGREPASAAGASVHTLEHVFSRIAAVLQKESINTAPASRQLDVVRSVLEEQRCLLIIDNFESVTDARVRPFLRNLPAPTKAIITSREAYDVADVLRLSGLDRNAAATLIRDEATRHDTPISEANIDRLVAVTHGVPLPIRLGVARIAAGEIFPAVIRWLGDAQGDITDYCIKGQAQLAWQRSEEARAVLLACSLFSMDCGASGDALAAVADISRFDRDEAVSVLLRLQLLQVDPPDRYRMLPITQRFARTQFEKASPEDVALVERWLSNCLDLGQQSGDELESGEVDVFDVEYPNVVNAARWCFESRRWEELYALAAGAWSYAYTHSLFADFEELLSMAYAAADALEDDQRRGRVELQRARLQLVQMGPESNGLMELLESALAKALGATIDSDVLVALYTKGYVHYRRKELDVAEGIANALMERASESGDERFFFWSHYRLSEVRVARGEFEAALESIAAAEGYATRLNSKRLRAHVLHRRGAVLMEQGRGAEAVPVLLEALDLDQRRGEIRYVANDMLNLATIYAGMSNRGSEALQVAEQVHALYGRLGMQKELMKAADLLAELRQRGPMGSMTAGGASQDRG